MSNHCILVVGRMHGDDDDTGIAYETDSLVEARGNFIRDIRELDDIYTDEDVERFGEFSTVYITSVWHSESPITLLSSS